MFSKNDHTLSKPAFRPASSQTNRSLWRHRRRNRVLFVLLVVLCVWLLWPKAEPPPFDPNYGSIRNISPSSRFAIATFLTGGGDLKELDGPRDMGNDGYFISTRMLGYQLLHNLATRCNSSYAIDFVVLVTANVPSSARQQLMADGAVVIEAEPIRLGWWVKTGVTRWKDQFLKLRLFELTQYDRLAFIDADSLIRGKLDALFDELEVVHAAPTLSSRQLQSDEAALPAQFMFGARSDNQLTGEREHPFPPLNTAVFSAGFWITAPSRELFVYFLSVIKHYGRFDPHTMEQSMLNYVFRRDGPMPWRELHWRWSATWPNEADVEGGVITLHEKLWGRGPSDLMSMWDAQRKEMETFYANR